MVGCHVMGEVAGFWGGEWGRGGSGGVFQDRDGGGGGGGGISLKRVRILYLW